jgi:hypothetical protein
MAGGIQAHEILLATAKFLRAVLAAPYISPKPHHSTNAERRRNIIENDLSNRSLVVTVVWPSVPSTLTPTTGHSYWIGYLIMFGIGVGSGTA